MTVIRWLPQHNHSHHRKSLVFFQKKIKKTYKLLFLMYANETKRNKPTDKPKCTCHAATSWNDRIRRRRAPSWSRTSSMPLRRTSTLATLLSMLCRCVKQCLVCISWHRYHFVFLFVFDWCVVDAVFFNFYFKARHWCTATCKLRFSNCLILNCSTI